MVAIYRSAPTPAVYADLLTDVLSGLNVREGNYLDPTWVPVVDLPEWETAAPEQCWIVSMWDSGLDYDLDGNAYQDDAPGEWPHSYHATQKGAEIEASYLESFGVAARRISVHYGYRPVWDCDKALLP